MAPGEAFAVGDWVSYDSPGTGAHPDSFGRVLGPHTIFSGRPDEIVIVPGSYHVRLWDPDIGHSVYIWSHWLAPLEPTDDQVARWLAMELAR